MRGTSAVVDSDPDRQLHEAGPTEIDQRFAIGATAMFLTTRIAVRAAVAAGGGGKIIAMSSLAAKVGAARRAHYAASKAAVSTPTREDMETRPASAGTVWPGWETMMATPADIGRSEPEHLARYQRVGFGEPVSFGRQGDDFGPRGVLGDPTGATAALGADLFQTAAVHWSTTPAEIAIFDPAGS